MRKFYAAIFSFLMLLFQFLSAQPPVITYSPVITGLTQPIDLVNAGDGSNRLFIAQQNGLVRMWNGSVLSDFLDVGSTGENLISFGGESGLLSMVFHPSYDGISNRYFFIYYTDLNGDIAIRRYETVAGNPNLADISSDVEILTIPHPANSNHNGGKLNFGPDGYLYFATGDGGAGNDPPNNAQNGASLLGKMIRIDVDNTNPPTYPNYAVPADNPYVSDPAIDDRIWAMGLRNPFRWSFDRQNGNMWIGDVGQGVREEINFRPAGSTGGVNYGWRCYEGYISTPSVPDCDPPNNIYPVFDYDNTAGAAVTGGYVYRGPDYPAFRGYYMATDVYSGTLYFLWPNGSGGFDSSSAAGPQNFVVGFGEDENGRLFAVSQGTGTVYQVVATGGTVLPVKLSSFTVRRFSHHNQLLWTTESEENTSKFHILFSNSGFDYSAAGTVMATRNTSGNSYNFSHFIQTNKDLYYRLGIEDDDGSLRYSAVVKISGEVSGIRIYPTLIRDRHLKVTIPEPVENITIVNNNGTIVLERKTGSFTGTIDIQLPAMPRGLYIVNIKTKSGSKTQKVLID